MINARRFLALALLSGLTVLAAEPAGAAARRAQPCRLGEVSQQVKTDRSSYSPGQPVKLTVIARNDSHRVCTPPGLVQVAIDDSSVNEVFHSGISLRWKSNKTWKPGHTFKWSTEWDQASAGSYRAHGGWDEFVEGTATFTAGG